MILTRQLIEDWHIKATSRAEKQYADELTKFFRKQTREVANRVKDLTPSKTPNDQAAAMVDMVYDPDQWNRELFDLSLKALYRTMAEGAVSEMLLHDLAFKSMQARKDTIRPGTMAQQFIDRYDLQIPPEAAEAPEWFNARAKQELQVTFDQDYWQKINETTRDDIERTLARGIEQGLSIRDLASLIEQNNGDEYCRHRATRVARTETQYAANAGHQVGMEHLEEDLGFSIGKQWNSLFMSTTRDTHAAADGQTTEGAKGMFTVGGYQTPVPGHWSLPPEERIECHCTIISDIVSEALEEQEV